MELYDNIKDVNAALEEQRAKQEVHYKYHLGGHLYIGVDSPYIGVNIRSWFHPNGERELKPGTGVFLKLSEWEKFYNIVISLDIFVPEITSTPRCINTHAGQQSWMECSHCNPDGFDLI